MVAFGDEAKGGEEFVVGMFEFIEEFDAGRIGKRTYVEGGRVLWLSSGAQGRSGRVDVLTFVLLSTH